VKKIGLSTAIIFCPKSAFGKVKETEGRKKETQKKEGELY